MIDECIYKIRNRVTGEWAEGATWTRAGYTAFYKSPANAQAALNKERRHYEERVKQWVADPSEYVKAHLSCYEELERTTREFLRDAEIVRVKLVVA